MADKMTEWGAGPRFTLYSAIYCVVMFGLSLYFNPLFQITLVPYGVLVWIGIFLFALGIPFYLFSLVPVLRAFKDRRLITSGVYGMCRHPVYSAWLLFFVPGLALFMNSWALLTAPLVMYFLVVTLVAEEDIYLTETFGQEYLAYRQKVPAVLPYGWLKRNT